VLIASKLALFFGVRFERRKVYKKSKPTWKLKHANSILETFEYFYQKSSKSISIILSYTVSKLVHFFETQCMSGSCGWILIRSELLVFNKSLKLPLSTLGYHKLVCVVAVYACILITLQTCWCASCMCQGLGSIVRCRQSSNGRCFMYLIKTLHILRFSLTVSKNIIKQHSQLFSHPKYILRSFHTVHLSTVWVKNSMGGLS